MPNRDGEISEAQIVLRGDLGKKVQKLRGDRHVSVSLSDRTHSLEPWVVDLNASQPTHAHGFWVFCPLHQRPTSATGQVGVEIGHAVVGWNCPGMLTGLYHQGGTEQVEQFVQDEESAALLAKMVERQIALLRDEIVGEDIATAPGVAIPIAPGTDTMEALLTHLRRHVEKLRKLKEEILAGGPLTGRI